MLSNLVVLALVASEVPEMKFVVSLGEDCDLFWMT